MIWFCKIPLLLLLWGISALLGWMESRKLTAREQELDKLACFFTQLASEMQYAADPIAVLLRGHLEESDLIASCFMQLEAGASFSESWSSAVAQLSVCNGEDRKILLRFGDSFGKMNHADQVQRCHLTAESLRQKQQQAQRQCLEKGKLYRSLGVLCGAGMVLLLW